MPAARILVVFHTAEGQSRKIAEAIAETLRSCGAAVDVHPTESAPPPDAYDAVIVGDAIRMVKHSRQLTRYVRDNVAALNARPSGLFQVSLTSVNPDREHTKSARELVDALLAQTGFEPDVVGMFAGRLAYSQYNFVIKRVMRWISKREGGDPDMHHDYEYTDWQQVEQFARDVFTRVAT